MTIKERIIELGKATPKRVIEIECLDGVVLSFTMPHGGPERASFRRKHADFIALHKDKVLPQWKEFMPEEGYGEFELGLIFMLHYLCDEKWSQQDVIEMFAANDIEMIAIGAALSKQVVEIVGKDSKADIEAKKPSTPVEESATGGREHL